MSFFVPLAVPKKANIMTVFKRFLEHSLHLSLVKQANSSAPKLTSLAWLLLCQAGRNFQTVLMFSKRHTELFREIYLLITYLLSWNRIHFCVFFNIKSTHFSFKLISRYPCIGNNVESIVRQIHSVITQRWHSSPAGNSLSWEHDVHPQTILRGKTSIAY